MLVVGRPKSVWVDARREGPSFGCGLGSEGGVESMYEKHQQQIEAGFGEVTNRVLTNAAAPAV